MNERTEHQRTPDSPDQVGVQMCAWHQGYSVTTLRVTDADGSILRACHSCRAAFDLPVVREQP